MAQWSGLVLLMVLAAAFQSASGGIPALIIFGDSTVDVGMNNYINTLAKCDFPPYGRDLPSNMVRRNSNGFVVTDFIAQRLNLSIPLPYLDPQAEGSVLLQGVSFASAGSGWLDFTSSIQSAVPLTQQLEYFKSYKNKLIALVGQERAAYILQEALYVFSTGTNDYANNYFSVAIPIYKAQYNLSQFHDLILAAIDQRLETLYSEGARKFALCSLPALGCLPSQITIYGSTANPPIQGCVPMLNDAAIGANAGVQAYASTFQAKNPGTQLLYLDTYTPLYESANNPAANGFDVTRRGCCGSGILEVGLTCTAQAKGTCTDASKYLFFDSFHPTQTFYKLVADQSYDKYHGQLGV